MQITFRCSKCEARLEIDADSAGAEVACPTCGSNQVVPRKGLEPGTTIGGFKLVKLIGRGGMGEVYLARQLSLDRMVALKLLSRSGSLSGDAAERFVEEIRLTARLEHPYLVTAFEAGEDAGILYLAMAYIRGATLHDQVRRHGPLKETETLVLGRKLASALAHAWRELKLLHRDIKPSNILLDSNGEPRLADLGLAKCLDKNDGRTVVGALLGTPNYMSPEQAEGREDIDIRADIYSLGATLYTAVTGQIPYEAASVVETLRRQATEPLPDPRTFAPELSEEFVGLIGAMLAREASDRPKSWEALVAILDRMLARYPGAAGILPLVETPSASSVSTTSPAPPPRNFAAIIAGISIAAALGVGAGLVWLRLGSGTESARPPGPEIPSASSNLPGPLLAVVPATSAPPDAPAPAPAAGPGEWRDDDILPRGGRPLDPALRDRIGAAVADARDYAQAHPEDIDGQIERFKKVAAIAPSGPLMHRIQEMIRAAPDMKRRAQGIAEASLRAETEEALRTGRHAEAIAKLEQYPGPFAAETKALRESLAGRLKAAAEEALQKASQERLSSLADRVASGVVKGNYLGAFSELDRAAADAEFASVLDSIRSSRALLSELAAVHTNLLKSFIAQKGLEVPVDFKSGKIETLQIGSVRGATVVGRRLLKEGFIERPFTLADLSLKEKERRLAAAASPPSAVAQGLLALESGETALAASRFLGSGTVLGAALARTASARHP
jgi:serine/threonine protein kinase/DNA-directed RNA polymerase subunit RPC12/RpoP